MQTFRAHEKPILGLAFSPDGNSLVTSSGDGSVKLWSLDPVELFGKQLGMWVGSERVAPVAFSPDGQFIACGGYSTSVWNKTTDAKVRIDAGFGDSVAFSPNEGILVVHRDKGDGLGRWKIPSGEKLAGGWGGTRASTGAARFPTGGMAFSPDGAILATTFGELIPGRYASVVYLWDAHTGEERGKLEVTEYADHPTELCFSPNGRLLAGASAHLMRVWNVRDKVEIAMLRLVGKKHFKSQIFSPDGKALLTVGQDDVVSRWKVDDWSMMEPIECRIGNLAKITKTELGTKPMCYAAGDAKGRIAIWEAD
jgi:WD40 repeat protein